VKAGRLACGGVCAFRLAGNCERSPRVVQRIAVCLPQHAHWSRGFGQSWTLFSAAVRSKTASKRRRKPFRHKLKQTRPRSRYAVLSGLNFARKLSVCCGFRRLNSRLALLPLPPTAHVTRTRTRSTKPLSACIPTAVSLFHAVFHEPVLLVLQTLGVPSEHGVVVCARGAGAVEANHRSSRHQKRKGPLPCWVCDRCNRFILRCCAPQGFRAAVAAEEKFKRDREMFDLTRKELYARLSEKIEEQKAISARVTAQKEVRLLVLVLL
jgi:hypothetical protein